MVLLDGRGLWVRDCPALFVSTVSFRIFGRSSPKEVLGTHFFLLKNGSSFDSVQFIFSLRYVKVSSFALPKKTAVSSQLFIVALTKATSLVRSFSDVC